MTSPRPQPALSVIVVNWNTRDLLRSCLASVIDQAKDVDVELLVVDNASADGSPEMVRQEFPEAMLQVNPSNRGFAAANNQAIKQAQGQYLFLLNSDAYLTRGALSAIQQFMDANADAAVVGTRVLNPDGTTQPSCFRFPTLWDVCCEMSFLVRLFPNSSLVNRRGMGGFDRRSTREVDWVLGAAMVVRKEWADRTRGLDEGYFMYVEEMDWCRRIRTAGGRVIFFPGAEVVHHGGVSRARAREMILPRAFASRFRYYDRFHGPSYTRLIRWATLAGMVPRLAATGLTGLSTGNTEQQEAFRAYKGVWQVAWNGAYTETKEDGRS